MRRDATTPEPEQILTILKAHPRRAEPGPLYNRRQQLPRSRPFRPTIPYSKWLIKEEALDKTDGGFDAAAFALLRSRDSFPQKVKALDEPLSREGGPVKTRGS